MRIELGDDDHIEIMLVPLIDCLCFLVFFFLAASTLKKAEKDMPSQASKSAVVQQGQKEVNLPDINLSKLQGVKQGKGLTKKSVVSIKMDGKNSLVFLDDKQVSSDQLATELKKLGGMGQVALRRDSAMPCSVEDSIILQCQKAGIDRVSIMVKAVD